MSAAEREAEQRWPEGLGRWTDPVRGLLLGEFVAGAEWQADHDPRIAAVRALHQPLELIHADAPAFPHRTLVCTECGTDKGQWRAWPCATIQAIEGDKT